MSISYNRSAASTARIRSMNRTTISKHLLVIAAVVGTTLRSYGQSPTPATASPLAPIAFLTSHEWDAKLPDSPDGKKVKIHAQFTWAQNRQAIRISNQFVKDGKPMPYIDGLYAWDPQQHAIVFWYVDAKGALTKGTVKLEDGKLVHEFQETQPDGKTADFVARVTPQGTQGWENEIFARKEKALTPIVKVHYEIAEK
jgi:dipeptidyl aminopeptidase/acylaminoacyl peptidase